MATDFKNKATATYLSGLSNINISSNEVIALAADGKITLTKTQSTDVLFSGDTQDYTISGTNSTGVGVTLFTLTDIIPAGLTFVAGSFKVDGVVKVPTVVANVLTYVYGAWANGDTHTFTFQCTRD